MEQGARRYLTAAAALTAAAGLVVASPAISAPMSASLPDVQVRDTDLTAHASDLHGSEINSLYEHIQQEFSGNTDAIQHDIGAGDLFANQDGFGLGGGSPTLNIDDLALDQNALDNLIGAGLDPAIFQETTAVGVDPGAHVLDGSPSGGLFGVNDQPVNAAASFISFSAADAIPGLQAAYQTMTEGLVAAELAYNSALVNTQIDTVERFFGNNTAASDFISWVFSVNNAALAQNETMLNSLLGANFDPNIIHGSLVNALNAEGFTLNDWASLLGISPDELSQIVSAAASSNLFGLLGSMDLGSLFPGLF